MKFWLSFVRMAVLSVEKLKRPASMHTTQTKQRKSSGYLKQAMQVLCLLRSLEKNLKSVHAFALTVTENYTQVSSKGLGRDPFKVEIGVQFSVPVPESFGYELANAIAY